MQELAGHSRQIHLIMLDLEHEAFNAGYPFAITTICGSCSLCDPCNIAGGICNRPTMRRFTPEGLGINIVKTAENAGIPIRFPAPENPERIAILLID
jgi:predicted metal-binding protein